MRSDDALKIFDQACPVHAILAWNPDEAFGTGASQGVCLWTDILKKQYEKRKKRVKAPYTWWPKISISGALGMPEPEKRWIVKFNEQIRAQGPDQETHLYMYCGYFYDEKPASLHVAKIIEVAGQEDLDLDDPLIQEQIPIEFIQNVREKHRDRHDVGALFPYWFKISDIREIRKDHLRNLFKLNTDVLASDKDPTLVPFSPVRFDSPLPVVEYEPRPFFDEEEISDFGLAGWWQEITADPLLVRDDFPRSKYSEKREITKWKALSVPRSEKAMAHRVAALLKASNEILFVDPYFFPHQREDLGRPRFKKSRWVDPLAEFLKAAAAGRKRPPSRLEYHARFGAHQGDYTKFAESCKEVLESEIPAGWELMVHLWKPKFNGEPFHARFILTEKAGVLFEHGLDTGDGEGLVALLTPNIHHQRWKAFLNPAEVYDTSGIGPISVRGKKKL
ncbi:MAG: hypothetical protein AB1733_19305 [Thermodesulfobacteriota bacterium]